MTKTTILGRTAHCLPWSFPEGMTLEQCDRLEARMTSGRCHRCNICWTWPPTAKIRLYQAHCPVCGESLAQTVASALKHTPVTKIDSPLWESDLHLLKETT